MIDQDRINISWINKVSEQNRKVDKILVEKVIRAFQLLEGLIKQSIPFVFKGGTALMLQMNSSKRLSIDIDIVLPTKVVGMEGMLQFIVKEQGFNRVELQQRSMDSNINKEHYKFFYTPIHKSNRNEEYVLLDVLFEEIGYAKVIEIPVTSTFVPDVGRPLLVKVPSLEDMLGDKLTAFAPNTTGIPYFKKKDSRSMEIIKQLYDIGIIFDVVNNLEVIEATFINFALKELAYREVEELTEKDVLEDIYQTSLCIVTRGADGQGDFEQLQSGIRRIRNYIFSENFHLDKAITVASKAA